MPFLIQEKPRGREEDFIIEYRTQARAAIDLFRFIAALFFA